VTIVTGIAAEVVGQCESASMGTNGKHCATTRYWFASPTAVVRRDRSRGHRYL